MSEDRKIIEHDGLKYYKQEGQWYQISPIDEDKVPVDIKIKKRMKLNLLPEIQLDVFKCLSFTQLLVVQQASVYFKNFISENEKVLAMKKFCRLEINLVNDETISCYKKCKQDPNLYDFKLEEHRPCDSGMCEKTFKFFKLKPQLYEFELSKRLEIKWKSAIEEPIPMFLTSDNELIRVDEDANTVDCKLERNYKQEKGSTYNELYYFQLSKFPKNVEEMKIARYFFQLLFNCTFDYFVVCNVIINPQMIDLLFDNDITTNKHLQIHSKDTQILSCDEHYLTFAWNHLVSNELLVEIYETFEEENLDILFKILANGGNKFSYIIYQFSNSKLYNFIIEHIETSQDISKMVKKIEFWRMHGSLISSERAKNVEIKEEEEGKKETKFQLVNKHNPKIEFSVLIKEGRTFNLTYSEDYDTLVPAVDAVIERIN